MTLAYPTTGTTAFNLDLTECIEEAFERAGTEVRSGYDVRSARRSLTLMMLEWANLGINMWLFDEQAITLVAGTATYSLPNDTIDLLDHVIRTNAGTNNQQDIIISRISNSVYAAIPNKLSQGRPIQVLVRRNSGAANPAGSAYVVPTITVWPVPDASTTYVFNYWRLRRVQDAGNGPNGQDVPFRFLPALVAGLAYYTAMKTPGQEQRAVALKNVYEQVLQVAMDEDREKAPVRFVPRNPWMN